MTLVTRPNIDNRQFTQISGTTFNWEGENDFVGILKSKGVEIDADASEALSGFTLSFINNKIKLVDPSSFIDSDFDSDRATTRDGIPSVNVGGTTIKEFLEEYFFPSVPPDSSINVSSSTREFGDDTYANISWNITRNTQPISSIEIEKKIKKSFQMKLFFIIFTSLY